MSFRPALAGFLGWMSLLAVGYFLSPTDGWGMIAWGALGLSGAAAMFWGVLRHQPRRPWPWFLLGLGMLFQAVGDVVWMGTDAGASGMPFGIHICYLIMFCLVFAGLIGLSRTGLPDLDRAGILDAFTLTAGVGLLSWIYLVAPSVDRTGRPLLDAVSAAWYPLGTSLIFVLVIRLVVGTRPSPALVLLAVGAVSLTIGEFLFLAAQLGGAWQVGTAKDLGWIIFNTCWGAAALHPSMAQLTEPKLVHSSDLTVPRLVLLACCALIPSAVLIAMALNGTVRSALALALLGAVMVLLVVARLFGALRRQRRALDRERRPRCAGATLVTAASTADIRQVVIDTVTGLIPAGMNHLTILTIDDWARLDATPTRLGSPDNVAVHCAVLRTYPTVLNCPLSSIAGNPHSVGLGRLLVGAGTDALIRLQGAIEILATQAAMTLTRIHLTEEISKKNSEAYFRALVQYATDAILIVDDTGTIRYHSPSAVALLGDRALDGQPAVETVIPQEREMAAARFNELLLGQALADDIEWTVPGTDGHPRHVTAFVRDLRADPTVAGFIVTLRDITEQRQTERELTYRAYHDPLTGLPNRALFDREVARAAEHADTADTLVGVLFIDLDDFKEINDSLGHIGGDQLLVAVAARLAGAVRPTDVAARLGGDEFAILVEHTTDPAIVDAVAERVIAALRLPIDVGEHMIPTSVSIGVATTADSGQEDLLHDADQALYHAKADGKGRWRRHTPQRS